MLTPRTTLARRVTAALDASPSRIPVLVGGCGSGRTTVLRQLRERHRPHRGAVHRRRADGDHAGAVPAARSRRCRRSRSAIRRRDAAGARAAFDATLAFFARARTPASEPATFLLDEFLELRTFESFPGLRRVLHDVIDGLAASGNRFVLTSRYVARTLRLLRDHSARFEVIHMPALTAEDTADILGPTAAPGGGDNDAHDADYLARTVQALADGRPTYVRALADELAALREHGGPGSGDAISALAGLLAPRGTPRQAVRVQLRAAAAPRARLRRAQGDPRDPRRRRRADAHRDLAPAAAHAGLDQGLSVVARGRRPGDVAAEALHLHRSAAARLGAAALPRRRRRPKTISRAKCTATRCRACRSRPSRRRRRRRPSRRSRWPAAPASGIIEID